MTTMKESNPVAIARKDYQPPNWTIDQTNLIFDLGPEDTKVTSTLQMRRMSAGPLVLDGSDQLLQSVSVDGTALEESAYTVGEAFLQIDGLPDNCKLQIVTRINPLANKALEGLYCSSDNFCTQCEAEGFRKITYYLDRPDVLSTFRVSLIANKAQYPVLLSNGNLESQEELSDGRHKVSWYDPFPKPCYLFALVAGDLARIEDNFKTRSGRDVQLHIYVEEHNLQQCQFAMDALKRSMLWDEQVYGLEYDLDLFMIVAVDDFNAGAMENKGLNVFNSKYVLADRNLATDNDFLGVEAVIAHEYFHNWTGNRVTCRDWFQLSLKEGLTVFRDQEFSADTQSRDVKRIQDVRMLRAQQFAEDASPMSHPIRPDEYIEVNNFYTLTVYEKGAEVIRMIHTLLGPEKYYRGIDLYFERHDGTAVTCDDFVQAMQDASGIDLELFRQWYSQSGTPQVSVQDSFDEVNQQYSLHIGQSNKDKLGAEKPALHIPLRLGLLDSSGQNLPLSLGHLDTNGSSVLDITEAQATFVFNNIKSKPTPSLLRGFSAPVVLDYDYDEKALAFLLSNDSDSFNRWDAGQRLAHLTIEGIMTGELTAVPDSFVEAFDALLHDDKVDAGFKALVLEMPGIKTICNNASTIDIQSIDVALNTVKTALAMRYQSLFSGWVTSNINDDGSANIGKRSLANEALYLLSYLPSEQWVPQALKQYQKSKNMTDRVAALAVLSNSVGDVQKSCLEDFYARWSKHKLVVDKWFSLQATAQHDAVIGDVISLMDHEAFDRENPNRLRSLIGAFASGNPMYFHASSGEGYKLVTDNVIRLDKSNPQVAARLVAPFLQWRRFTEPQKSLMRESLKVIAAVNSLSADVFEIVSRALDD